MTLSAEQLATFDAQGYIFFPAASATPRSRCCATRPRPSSSTIAPKSGARNRARRAPLSPCTRFSDVFALLARHPRLIEPVRQLFGEDVYVHQFKLNAKAAFEGDVWQWHQDFGTWQRDDGMPKPRAMNIAVFLDEVMPINGPLLLIPKSQRALRCRPRHDDSPIRYGPSIRRP